MVKGDRQAWKQAYFEKANALLGKYERIFICDADNVSSKQFQVRSKLQYSLLKWAKYNLNYTDKFAMELTSTK